jgi:hypothetical protein
VYTPWKPLAQEQHAPKGKPAAAEPAAANNLIDRLFPIWNDAEVAADKGDAGAQLAPFMCDEDLVIDATTLECRWQASLRLYAACEAHPPC